MLKSILISILKLGRIPEHVAFIMDGNRRFAQKNQMKTSQGHILGFSSLSQILETCLKLGIKVVSIYAFSIENFKRTPEEVDRLMELATQKFEEFSRESSMVDKLGISVRVSGALHLLPKNVQIAAYNAIEATKNNSNAVLNIYFPYTSRNEIATAMSDIITGYKSETIRIEDIDASLIEKCLFIGDLPRLQLLIRTSGEIRFSDFMLWQACDKCLIHFTDVLWPEFSYWDLAKAIFAFQRNYKKIIGDKCSFGSQKDDLEKHTRIENFMKWLQEHRNNLQNKLVL